MRELNECTAEVFRRSEKRIKARQRNRNRVLAVCIPICLIAAVWSVMALPAAVLKETSDRAGADRELDGAAQGGPACPCTAAEIQEDGMLPGEHYGKVTDPVAVAEMYQAVQSLFAGDAGTNDGEIGWNFLGNGSLPAEENNTAGDLADEPDKSRGYTITFTAGDSSQTVYYFSGNALVDVSTNETVFLSDAQAAGLLAVLGLTE